jgi:uncharacterized SAM-binding protein YcdF (DUF218 family)
VNVVLYLGAENDAHGKLSEMALARAQGALATYRRTPNAKLLVTGGYGHFNPAPRPHAHYVVEHMLAQGVPAEDLLPIIESRNTVEDAAFAREALASLEVDSIGVVTSTFHVPRTRLIFACFFDPALLSFVGTPDNASAERVGHWEAHERESIATIRRQGGILYQGRLWPLPT